MGRVRRNSLTVWASIWAVLVVLALPAPLAVAGVAEPISTTTNAVVASIPLEVTNPLRPTYDGANGDLYVSGMNGPASMGMLTVVSGATNQIVATAPLGVEPVFPTVDPVNNAVYVPNSLSAGVTVVSGTSNAVLVNVRVIDGDPDLGGPMDVTWDSANGNLYVPDGGNVGVISGSNNTVVTNISVAGYATAAYFDGSDGNVYVADRNSPYGETAPNELTVVSGTTNTVTGSIFLGDNVYAALLNPTAGYIYAAYTGGLSLISVATNTVIENFSTSWGVPAFLGPEDEVYFFQSGAPANVTVVNGSSNTLVTRYSVGEANDLALDPANGDLYTTSFPGVVNVTSTTTHALVQTIDFSSLTANFLPFGPVYDPGNGEMYVIAAGSTSYLVALSTNATVAVAQPASASNVWTYFAIGIGVGAVAMAGVALFTRRRKSTNEGPREEDER